MFVLATGLERSRLRRRPLLCIGLAIVCLVVFVLQDHYARRSGERAELQEIIGVWTSYPTASLHQSCPLPVDWDEVRAIERAKARLPPPDVERPPFVHTETLCKRFNKKHASRGWRQFAYTPGRGLIQVGTVTHIFLHGSWAHLIGNMLIFLLVAGPILEVTWGRRWFLVLLLIGASAGSIGHYVVSSPSMAPMVGASGGISACIGALLGRFPFRRIIFRGWFLKRFRFHVPVWAWALWLFFGDLLLVLVGGASTVAAGAHVGGFLFGLGLALTLRFTGLEERILPSLRATTIKRRLGFAANVYEAIDRGEVERARIVLQTAMRKDPANIDALMLLAKVERTSGNREEGQRHLHAALTRIALQRDEDLLLSAFEELRPTPAEIATLGGRHILQISKLLFPYKEHERLAETLAYQAANLHPELREEALSLVIASHGERLRHRFRFVRRALRRLLPRLPSTWLPTLREELSSEDRVLASVEVTLFGEGQTGVGLVPAAAEVLAHRGELSRLRTLLKTALGKGPTGKVRADIVRLLQRYA